MITSLFTQAVRTVPENIAVVCDKQRLSYQELFVKTLDLSVNLKKAGVQPKDKVMVLLPNGPELVIIFLAIARMGAQLMMLNPTSTNKEVGNKLQKLTPRFIITNQEQVSLYQNSVNKTTLKKTKVLIIESLLSKKYNDIYEYVVRDANKQYDNDFLYLLSSGSTGSNKMVCHTQRNVYDAAIIRQNLLNIEIKDCILCQTPLYISPTYFGILMAALGVGATIILPDKEWSKAETKTPFVFRCLQIAQLIKQEKVTVLQSVPYVYQLLTDLPIDPTLLSSLRLCVSMGSKLEKSVFDNFKKCFGHQIKQQCGSVEVGLIAMNAGSDEDMLHNSVGKPVEGVEVQIIDNKNQEVPTGTIGRVKIKSSVMVTGYINQPKLSAQAFKNGWFITDDLGKMDSKGRLFLSGRISDWIEIGGHKVDPNEVEQVLLDHKNINEVVVVGEKKSDRTILKAVIVTKSMLKPSTDELKEYCWNKLSSHKVPQVFEFRNKLPRTTLGKIKRFALVNKIKAR